MKRFKPTRTYPTQTINGPVHLYLWPVYSARAGDMIRIIGLTPEPLYLCTGRMTEEGYHEALYLDPEDNLKFVAEEELEPIPAGATA